MTIARQTTRTNYDRLSRWYDILSGSSERPARVRGMQMLNIQPGERVLEIGCGTGESLPMLAHSTEDAGHVIGLDLSAGMLRVAKYKLGKQPVAPINFVQGDAIQLPFGEVSFDALFMSFTLELFPSGEIPILLRECRRVLRSGGRMGVVSLLQKENPGWMEKTYTWAHRRWPQIIDCRPVPLEQTLTSVGFEISRAMEMSMWGLAVSIVVAANPT
jgi:ubiquinone/menaquinone biosynthesis C-methylase UbiE